MPRKRKHKKHNQHKPYKQPTNSGNPVTVSQTQFDYPLYYTATMTSTLIGFLLTTIIQNTTDDDNTNKEAILNGLHAFTYAGIAMTLTCCVLRCMYPAENKKLKILEQRIKETQQRQAEIDKARYLKIKAKEARKRARNEAARIHTSLKTNSSSTGNDGSNELSSSSSSEDYSAVLDRKAPSSPENNGTSSDDTSISSDPLNTGYNASNEQSSLNLSNSSEDNSTALTSIKTKNHQKKSQKKINPIAQRIKARQAEKKRKTEEDKKRKRERRLKQQEKARLKQRQLREKKQAELKQAKDEHQQYFSENIADSIFTIIEHKKEKKKNQEKINNILTQHFSIPISEQKKTQRVEQITELETVIATKLHKQINEYYQTESVAAKSIQQAYIHKKTRKKIEQYINNFKRIKHAVRELQTFVRLRQRNHAAARVLQTLGRSFLFQQKKIINSIAKTIIDDTISHAIQSSLEERTTTAQDICHALISKSTELSQVENTYDYYYNKAVTFQFFKSLDQDAANVLHYTISFLQENMQDRFICYFNGRMAIYPHDIYNGIDLIVLPRNQNYSISKNDVHIKIYQYFLNFNINPRQLKEKRGFTTTPFSQWIYTSINGLKIYITMRDSTPTQELDNRLYNHNRGLRRIRHNSEIELIYGPLLTLKQENKDRLDNRHLTSSEPDRRFLKKINLFHAIKNISRSQVYDYAIGFSILISLSQLIQSNSSPIAWHTFISNAQQHWGGHTQTCLHFLNENKNTLTDSSSQYNLGLFIHDMEAINQPSPTHSPSHSYTQTNGY